MQTSWFMIFFFLTTLCKKDVVYYNTKHLLKSWLLQIVHPKGNLKQKKYPEKLALE